MNLYNTLVRSGFQESNLKLKLTGIADCSIEEFMNRYRGMTFPNRFYTRVFNHLNSIEFENLEENPMKNASTRTVSAPMIPVKVLEHHDINLPVLARYCEMKKYSTLRELVLNTPNRFELRKNYREEYVRLLDGLNDETFVAALYRVWKECFEEITVPNYFNRETCSIESVLDEVISFLKKREPRNGRMLELYIRENMPVNEIAGKYGCTVENVRRIVKTDTLERLFSGKSVCGIRINKAFLDYLDAQKAECIYKPVVYKEQRLIGRIFFDILDGEEMNGQEIIVRNNEIRACRRMYKHLMDVLNEIAVPESVDVIMEKVKQAAAADRTKSKTGYNEEFVKSVLFTHPDICSVNSRFVLKQECLKGVGPRCKRILYEHGDWMKKDDLFDAYRKFYRTDVTASCSALKACPDLRRFSNYWIYEKDSNIGSYDQTTLIPVVLDKLGADFTMDDVDRELAAYKVLDIFDAGSKRTNITNLCAVSSRDHNHFYKINRAGAEIRA